MKDLGYGEGYRYAHDHESGFVYQQNLPDALEGRRYYEPTAHGFEITIGDRLAYWRKIGEEEREKRKGSKA